MVHKQKNTKKLFKVWKLGVHNFAFLDTYGHLAMLRPNALGQWPQILHTTYHVPGASSCKISGHMAKFRLLFLAKNTQKRPKKCKKMVFFGWSSLFHIHAMVWCSTHMKDSLRCIFEEFEQKKYEKKSKIWYFCVFYD